MFHDADFCFRTLLSQWKSALELLYCGVFWKYSSLWDTLASPGLCHLLCAVVLNPTTVSPGDWDPLLHPFCTRELIWLSFSADGTVVGWTRSSLFYNAQFWYKPKNMVMNLIKLQQIFFSVVLRKKALCRPRCPFCAACPFPELSERGSAVAALCLCLDLDLQRFLYEVFGGASAFKFDVVTCCVP